MPIVDGLTATKMIRSFEKTHTPVNSRRAAVNGRVPIFAVSASLVERERETYIKAGFDGWILKPIDFKRVNVLLEGLVDCNTRRTCLYTPGVEWEHGGWFCMSQPSTVDAETTPSGMDPTSGAALLCIDSVEAANKDSISSVGSLTPTKEPSTRGNIDDGMHAAEDGADA